jgi:acetamidase/formamidase
VPRATAHRTAGRGEITGQWLEISMDVEFTVDVIKAHTSINRGSRIPNT